MTWQMRHEGSPNVTSNLSAQQVLEGVAESVWSFTDEVRGANEMKWLPVEEHPFFAEAIAEMEQPEPYHDVETHLDMNPLIDVALVLLIFFILTTTYDALRKVMDLPQMSKAGQNNIKVIDNKTIENEYVRVEARLVNDKAVYKVDGQDVSEENLRSAIGQGFAARRTKLLIDAEGVTWDSVCRIIDEGKRFGMKMQIRVQKE